MSILLRRVYICLVALGLLCLSLVWFGRARAASSAFIYDTEVQYTALDDTTTQVKETYTVTNQTARQYLTELKLTTPSDKITSLSVRYSDGGTIPTKVTASKASGGDFGIAIQQIAMSFPRVNAGSGLRWQFVVSYKTEGLIETKGSSHTVYVPAIAQSNQRNSYSVAVDVPQAFGTPHFAGSDDRLVSKNDGRQVYAFTEQDLNDRSQVLVFGDSTIYNLVMKSPLENNSPVPRNFTVTLPPDLSTQSVTIKKLTPAPKSTRLDADGNILAEYSLGAYQKLTVVAELEGQANYRDYNLAKSGTRQDIPNDIVAAYTRPTHYWPTGGAVAQAARSVTKPSAKVSDNVHAIYNYVINKLTYNNDKIKFNVRQGASKALTNPNNAVCLEYADLMIAMLRSQGIPARMVVGYAYAGSIKTSPAVADSLHSWVEAYIPGVGWMAVDPTWGEKFDDFGRSDLDHFAFAIWGRNDNSPSAVMSGSRDTGYQYENTQLSFSNAATSVPSTGSLEITRYSIFPFIAVDQVNVTAQAQVVSTGNILVIDGDAQTLGSLAPAQHLSFRSLALGSGWNKSVSAELQRQVGGNTKVIAKTTTHISHVPMLVLVVGLIALWLLIMLRLRSKQRSSRVKKIYTDYKNRRDILDE